MPRLARVLVGFIAAPFVAAATVTAVFPLIMNETNPMIGRAALITGAVITVLGAMPVHVGLRRSGRGGLAYLCAGAVLGTTPFLLYLAFLLPALLVEHNLASFPFGNLVRLAIIGALAGATAAFAFWLVAGRA